MRTDRELLELLRKYAHTGHLGGMGNECVVDKAFLNEVANRFEELAFAVDYEDFNPSHIPLWNNE